MTEAGQTTLLCCLGCRKEVPTYSVGVGRAVRTDDSLRRANEACAPALCFNKGKDVAPQKLSQHIRAIIPRLLKSVRAA